MATIDFRADLKLATETLEAIERAVVGGADERPRPHLGASIIGRGCERAIWYSFRWAVVRRFDGRMLRLFARGQREEDVFALLLRKAGVQVVTHDPDTGEQYRFGAGHFGGSMDGACLGLPEAPNTWHVLEEKTHNAKSFADLVKNGVAKSKPEHEAQMQCYMAWTGMKRALYAAVCKDDDSLHLERIEFDKARADQLFAKAQRIIEAKEPPAKVSEDPSWYVCKCCDFHGVCHGTDAPLPTCRSCAHVTPAEDGQWLCEQHKQAVSADEQWSACQAHRFIPALLTNWAEAVEADIEANTITYRNKLTDKTFTNGLPVGGWSSEEIHAASDKRAIGNADVNVFREAFDARVGG